VIRRLVPIGIVAAFSAVLVSYLAYTWKLSLEMRANASVFSQIYFQVVQAVASPEGMTAGGEFELLLQLYDLEIPVVQTDLEGNPTLIRNLPGGSGDFTYESRRHPGKSPSAHSPTTLPQNPKMSQSHPCRLPDAIPENRAPILQPKASLAPNPSNTPPTTADITSVAFRESDGCFPLLITGQWVFATCRWVSGARVSLPALAD